jgi:putative heme-binding domain-containing protein
MDAASGSKLFAAKCATCHRHQSLGKDFGPKLAALSDKSTSRLLRSILQPNRAIESKYRNYTCLTQDGRALTGMLVAEDSGSVTLAQPNGEKITLLRLDIEHLEASEVSFMPIGLGKGLDAQDFANLFAFLRAGELSIP